MDMVTCNVVIFIYKIVFSVDSSIFLKYFTHFLYNYITHNLVCFMYLNPYLLKAIGNEHDVEQHLLLLSYIVPKPISIKVGYTFEILFILHQ